MVTASHNENGWTGVKMGIKKGLTHGPEEMKELKEITLNKKFIVAKGKEKEIQSFQQIYKNDLIKKNKIKKKNQGGSCMWKWNGWYICSGYFERNWM